MAANTRRTYYKTRWYVEIATLMVCIQYEFSAFPIENWNPFSGARLELYRFPNQFSGWNNLTAYANKNIFDEFTKVDDMHLNNLLCINICFIELRNLSKVKYLVLLYFLNLKIFTLYLILIPTKSFNI